MAVHATQSPAAALLSSVREAARLAWDSLRSQPARSGLAIAGVVIGIVTVVRDDHSSKEYSREAIAEEKGKLIAALPATGTAVLNADDELVLAMAARSSARVIAYGLSRNAELRAEDISSVWPERLQMTLVRGSERIKLRTRLCGTHLSLIHI